MVLREWAQAWNFYKTCNTRHLITAVYSPKKVLTYWYLWISTIIYAVSVGLFASEGSFSVFFGFPLAALSLLALYASSEKAIAHEFWPEYTEHFIASHPFGSRRLYLRYALFLKNFRAKGFSSCQIDRLIRFSNLVGPPEPATRFSDNIIVVPLITITTILTADWVRQTNTWKEGNGLFFLFIIALGFVFIGLTLDILQSPRKKRQELERFLQWAKLDIDEEIPAQHI